ncbi:hypothetical protein Droror1_Dr00005805 [Drosera rotundifolia]
MSIPGQDKAVSLVIWHPLHPHPLSLFRRFCDGCKNPNPITDSRYYCEDCDFDLHYDCAMSPGQDRAVSLVIQYPLHPHPLCLGSLLRVCDGCQNPITGSRYWCKACNFDLHYDCAMSRRTSPPPVSSLTTPLVRPIELDLAKLKLNSGAPAATSRTAAASGGSTLKLGGAAATPIRGSYEKFRLLGNQHQGRGMGNPYSFSRDLKHTVTKAAVNGVVHEGIRSAFHDDDDDKFSSSIHAASSPDNSFSDDDSFSYDGASFSGSASYDGSSFDF